MSRNVFALSPLLLLALISCQQASPPPVATGPGPWQTLPQSSEADTPAQRPLAPPRPIQGQALGKDIPHLGSAERFPNPSSTTVVADQSGNSDSYTSGSIRLTLPIRRYVGDKSRAIAAGTLSAKTTVLFPVYDVDTRGTPCAERDTAFLNGQRLGDLTGDNGIWRMQRFTVDTASLNFPSAPGQTATNTFTVNIDVNGCNTWLTEVDWVALKFEASPPIVFVHGILSDGDAWDGFKAQVQDRGMVADNSITLPYNDLNTSLITQPGQSCNAPAFDTVTRNRTRLVKEFRRIAQQHGTEALHVVGHSKGGMDAKAAISQLRKAPTNVVLGQMNGLPLEGRLEVNSLITLNTPHLGSPVADLGIVKILEDEGLARDNNFKDLANISVGTFNFLNNLIVGHLLSKDHICDLTQQKAASINRMYPISVPAFGTGTDASSTPANPRRTLSGADADLAVTGVGIASDTWQSVYRFTGFTRSITYRKVTVSNFVFFKKEVYEAVSVRGGWIPNDVLVTTTSARGSGLPLVLNGHPGQHHTEVNQPGYVSGFVTNRAMTGSNGVNWTVK